MDNPSQLNTDPHGSAWMVKIELSDSNQLKELLDADAYGKYVSSLK